MPEVLSPFFSKLLLAGLAPFLRRAIEQLHPMSRFLLPVLHFKHFGYQIARRRQKLFPTVFCCHSNHGSLYVRGRNYEKNIQKKGQKNATRNTKFLLAAQPFQKSFFLDIYPPHMQLK